MWYSRPSGKREQVEELEPVCAGGLPRLVQSGVLVRGSERSERVECGLRHGNADFDVARNRLCVVGGDGILIGIEAMDSIVDRYNDIKGKEENLTVKNCILSELSSSN